MSGPRTCAAAVSTTALMFLAALGDSAAQTTETSPAGPPPPSTSSPTPGCGSRTACLANPECTACFDAVSRHGVGHFIDSFAERTAEIGFFQALLSERCNSSTVWPALFDAVAANCTGGGVAFSHCEQFQVECFGDPVCGQCLAQSLTAPELGGPSDGRDAVACFSRAPPVLALKLTDLCWSLPACSLSKAACRSDPLCTRCWAKLQRGDVVAATAMCNDSGLTTGLVNEATGVDFNTSWARLNTLAAKCIGQTATACHFWRLRCNEDATCRGCRSALGTTESATWHTDVIAGSQSTDCAAIRSNPRTHSALMLYRAYHSCPASSGSRYRCSTALLNCMMFGGAQCAECAEAPSSARSPDCGSNVRYAYLEEVCADCPPSVALINRVDTAISVVAGLGLAASLTVLLVIVAYALDRASIRDAMIEGLMIACVIYSSADILPLNKLETGVSNCGQFANSFTFIRAGRAWWFGGLFAVALFLIALIFVSEQALKHGQIPSWAPPALTTGCVLGGVAAFTGFYVRCEQINANGYNAETQQLAFTNSHAYLDTDDDLDDFAPHVSAAARFESARKEFNQLVQAMLQAWCALLAIAALLWAYFQSLYRGMLRAQAELEEGEAPLRSVWATDADFLKQTTRWRLLSVRRDALVSLAQPLQPYIFFSLLFGVPSIVMATDYCVDHSAGAYSTTAGTLSYGTCYVWCELVLSFRSLVFAGVFFGSARHRAQLFATGELLRRLRRRASTWWDYHSGAQSRVRFDADDSIGIIPTEREGEDGIFVDLVPYVAFEDAATQAAVPETKA